MCRTLGTTLSVLDEIATDGSLLVLFHLNGVYRVQAVGASYRLVPEPHLTV